MAIIFPIDPAVNERFIVAGKTWRWDGVKWNLITLPLLVEDFLLEGDLGELEVNLVPKTDDTVDLGSASLKWKDLYLSGDSIYLGDLVLKETEAGGLGVFSSDGATPASVEIAEGSIADALLSDDGGEIKDRVSTIEGEYAVSLFFEGEAVPPLLGSNNATSDWTLVSTGPYDGSYTANVTVAGLLTTDNPIVDLDLNDISVANWAAIENDWSLIKLVEITAADTITFYASEEPTEDLYFVVKVVR